MTATAASKNSWVRSARITLFLEKRFNFLLIFLVGLRPVKSIVGETHLAGLIEDKRTRHGLDASHAHELLFGIADDRECGRVRLEKILHVGFVLVFVHRNDDQSLVAVFFRSSFITGNESLQGPHHEA